jgi:hypothetical protein
LLFYGCKLLAPVQACAATLLTVSTVILAEVLRCFGDFGGCLGGQCSDALNAMRNRRGDAAFAPSALGSFTRVQCVQLLARLEAHRLAGSDADLGAGAGIAADTGFAGADTEDAESAQFNAFAGGESLFETLEDRIHRSFRLGAGEAGTLNYMMDDVLFNQWGNLVGPTEMTVLRSAGLMLQVLKGLWNKRNRHRGFL